MLYEIMASLRLYLATTLPELSKVQLMYDGISTSKLKKPFATIEYLSQPTTVLSAGRWSVQEVYTFQVGVFAEEYTELIQLQGIVKEKLQQEVPLYDAELVETSATFVCDVSDFTPIRNDDLANETSNHRGYFEVSITILRNVGSTEFTQ